MVRYLGDFLDPNLSLSWSRSRAAVFPCRDMLGGFGNTPGSGSSEMHRSPCRCGLWSSTGHPYSWL